MADEIREVLRAAQEAEIRGDRAHAAELLQRAASLYQAVGRPSRALVMLRHARALDASRPGLVDEIRRVEALAAEAANRSDAVRELDAERRRLETPARADAPNPRDVDEPTFTSSLEVLERGPTLADPAIGAWCSFCCRPTREVGPLVAGPAGAYVCAACVGEAAKLIGAPAAIRAEPGAVAPSAERSGPSAPISAPAVLPRQAPPPALLPHQTAAAEAVARAIEGGARCILLIGSPGAGKSTLLRALNAVEGGLRAPDGRRPFLADIEGEGEFDWTRVARDVLEAAAAVVLAVRGRLPDSGVTVRVGSESASVPSTAAIAAAVEGMPQVLAEHVDAVVVLEDLDRDELAAVAAAALVARGCPDEIAVELAASVAAVAQASGRNGHEAVALARRVPPDARPVATQRRKASEPRAPRPRKRK